MPVRMSSMYAALLVSVLTYTYKLLASPLYIYNIYIYICRDVYVYMYIFFSKHTYIYTYIHTIIISQGIMQSCYYSVTN